MANLLDDLIAQVLRLDIRLHACVARLGARTDGAALSDLRVALLRLRGLMRPLRGLPVADVLDEAVAAVGSLSGPLRDQELLVAELEQQGLFHLAKARRNALEAGYAQLLQAAGMDRLFLVLDAWPRLMRVSEREGVLARLHKRMERRLARDWGSLCRSLKASSHDRDRLRQLIERVRQEVEAYPAMCQASPRTLRLLIGAQVALGVWHDRTQCLMRAEQEAELRPQVRAWQVALHAAEVRSDRVLDKLLASLR